MTVEKKLRSALIDLVRVTYEERDFATRKMQIEKNAQMAIAAAEDAWDGQITPVTIVLPEKPEIVHCIDFEYGDCLFSITSSTNLTEN